MHDGAFAVFVGKHNTVVVVAAAADAAARCKTLLHSSGIVDPRLCLVGTLGDGTNLS